MSKSGLLFPGAHNPVLEKPFRLDSVPADAPNYTDTSVLARASDPQTSHAAGRRAVDTGLATGHLARILAVLEETPGLTATEIGARCQLTNVQVCRRSREMMGAGWVQRDTGGRECVWVRKAAE